VFTACAVFLLTVFLCRYLVVPVVHGWVITQAIRHRAVSEFTAPIVVAVAASATVALGVAMDVWINGADRCDAWPTVMSCVIMVLVGLSADRSFSWRRYVSWVEAAAIFIVIAANPLEFQSRSR
jgi:hypothetical protein